MQHLVFGLYLQQLKNIEQAAAEDKQFPWS